MQQLGLGMSAASVGPPFVGSYTPPCEFPRLADSKELTIDLETYDPHLTTLGPGTCRPDDGHIVGIAVRRDDGWAEYHPVGHHYGPNIADPERVFSWLRDEMKDFNGELVSANLGYDVDWLSTKDIRFGKRTRYRDIQYAEPLLDENAPSFSLEALASKHLGEGKTDEELFRLYGDDVKANMHLVHAGHMRPYALGDVTLPPRILKKQRERLAAEDLLDVFDVECALLPLLQYIREVGVRVDLPAAERFGETLQEKYTETLKRIRLVTGFDVNVWAHDSLARAFDDQHIQYRRTDKGTPSFTSEWLKADASGLAALVLAARKYDRFGTTFVRGYILDAHVNGRLHCLFHPLKSEHEFGSFGTVSGRFSSSHPNLQNIPKRDDVLGPLCRALFLPEEGCEWWSKDYSQIEFRCLVHYAVAAKCNGAGEAQKRYLSDPKTDYHVMVSELTGLVRKLAKNINFGLVYGMGRSKLARSLGKTLEEAEPIFEQYHSRVPYARELYRKASNQAQEKGTVRTILQRIRRFDLWEPAGFSEGGRKPGLPLEEAKAAYGKVQRAYTHKALNGILQGSAADISKKALVNIWKEGLVGHGAPLHLHLLVHDEFDGSLPPSLEAEEASERITELMAAAIPMHVPVLVDGGTGPNWSVAH